MYFTYFMNNDLIRIGTRKSPLAVWQAELVQKNLESQGYHTEMVLMSSEGDIDLVTPLYAMGVQGVFTKVADTALLNHQVDIAVHSFKDVPIQLAKGLKIAAVLKRDSPLDILVFKNSSDFLNDKMSKAVIATGSIRRNAQWLHKYPHHKIENLRGNVNTRLQKLEDNAWNGAIFAAAGLERINIRPENSINLDWMLPAPAQGAIAVACRQEDNWLIEACAPLNHFETALCTHIEREFLNQLMGGCSTPIAALAEVVENTVILRGNVCNMNGSKKIDITMTQPIKHAANLGVEAANEILKKGADVLIKEMRSISTQT
jgi:hydroxymethylbilane synthase